MLMNVLLLVVGMKPPPTPVLAIFDPWGGFMPPGGGFIPPFGGVGLSPHRGGLSPQRGWFYPPMGSFGGGGFAHLGWFCPSLFGDFIPPLGGGGGGLSPLLGVEGYGPSLC